MKKFTNKIVLIFCSIVMLFIFSCDSWMNNDNIYADIEYEVKVANAPKINVYVRYAMNRQGETTPNGNSTFKVGIPYDISAVTDPEYGFVRWAAFTTDYLSSGDEQSKNKDIYFIDDEDYNKRILPHELSSEIVSFENSKSPTTVVTINKERNDIYLVPIIAQRPTVGLSIPSKGSSGVVRNMSVRINFTKPMDPESFKNAQGEFDKITITQGIQTYTSDGDIELNSEDITDHFEFNDSMFSLNKKMITLKFNADSLSEGYASQSSVNVTISKEVKDIFGFTMTDDNEITFSVGSKKDSLAPRITRLTAGAGGNFEAFQGVYKDVGTIENLGQKTRMTLEGASLAPTDNIEDEFYNTYVTNRIGKTPLVLRVYAEDLAGSGSGQSLDGIEADVARIGIRAKHLYNADGTEDKNAQMSDITYMVYMTGQNNTSLSGSYRDLVNKANSTLSENSDVLDSSYGSLFEYDLSGMPDGLIQVDVSAVDLVQNIGFFEGGTCSSEYGNGYTSLFIVKDTTPPDAEANKDFVQADLSIVPNGRGFFNKEYYKKLAVIQSPEDSIKDAGNYRLAAPNSELKWIIVPGSDTSWTNSITADDERWKFVKDGYTPAESALPQVDGPVDFTYALMDNLGNISDAVLFKSVMYDDTVPAIGDVKIEGINGYISTSVTGNVLENQIISIPVTDQTAGLESVEISTVCIKENESLSEYELPFESCSLEVKVNGKAYVRDVDYTIEGKKLTFKDTIVGDSTVTIRGLQIAQDGSVVDNSTYSIRIKVTDAALNSSSVNTCDIKNDSTPPVINYVKVKNINSGISGNSAQEFWSTENEPLTDLYISITETNTGVKLFDFAGSAIKLREDSVLIWNEEEIPSDVISIDTAANKLTITDEYKTIITNENGGEVIIRNVELAQVPYENNISLVVNDLVMNSSVPVANITIEDGTVINMFRYDGNTPAVNYVVLKDQAPGTGGAAEDGYTDNEYIEATVNVTSTDSGVYQITIDGASFGDTTLVNNKKPSDEAEGFAISADGSTITLRTNQNTVNRLLKGTFDIRISNIKLPAGDGIKNVSFFVTSAANRASSQNSASQSTIILDKTAPGWNGDGVFVAQSNAVTEKNYPHSSTSSNGNVKIGGTVYFYTKDYINIAADISETNRKDGFVDLFIDDSAVPVAEYINVAPGEHKVYAVDKAGNKSDVRTFFVIGDTTGPASFDGYITFVMPAGGNIYRGNAETNSIKNYILKKNSVPYQIFVKLAGVTVSEFDVHGNARTALGRFPELDPLKDSSPVEYFAFSTDGKTEWLPIANGQITIDLPYLEGECTPYTVYLKDGCGNVSSEIIPVNWKVDGNVVLGGKDLDRGSLYVNKTEGKQITYYKGEQTPVLSLTGFNDSCYYPDDETVEAGINKSEEKYTLKSRVIAWPAALENAEATKDEAAEPAESSEPAEPAAPVYEDFYSTSIDKTRFSDWSYLTLKTPEDSFNMVHHYPKYDTKTTKNPDAAYKLYYIIEDKLGNYTINQLKNDEDGTELWMYDNTPPTITVETAGNVNTIDGTNYFSDVSSLSLNITDTQSGIRWDGSKLYTDAEVVNTLPSIVYSLATIDPRDDFTVKINGLKDFVENVMPDTEGLKYNSKALWLKQTEPKLPDDPASILSWGGIANGTSNYTSQITTKDDGSKVISVKAPRSVTSLKFGLKVDQTLADGNADTTELLGWIITTEPLTTFEEFYDSSRTGSDGDIVVLKRNGSRYEYDYSKAENQKWEEIENKTQYFYAVNRAGIICKKPVIIEFAENTVPAITEKIYSDVKTFEDVNYIKASSTIKFVTNKDSLGNDVAITKAEFYIGSSYSPALTKEFAVPVTEYTLTSADSSVLPKLSGNSLFVKLYTASEESVKYELSDENHSTINSWIYDDAAPEIKKVFIKGIKEGTASSDESSSEFWATEEQPQAALYITFVETNTGAKVFDFAGSTIKLREDTVFIKNGVELASTEVAIDTTENRLTIADGSTIKTSTSADEIIIKNFDLVEQQPYENRVNLAISDFVMNVSSKVTDFTIKDESNSDKQISMFKYDSNVPVVNSVVLKDQAPGTGGINAGVAENGYTDSEYIEADLNITATASGVYKITINGASFDDTTLVNGKAADDSTEGFVISGDGKTITLRTKSNSVNRLLRDTFDLKIGNVKLSAGDGKKDISFEITNLAGRTSVLSDNAKTSIILDKTAPVWVGDGIFVSENNADAEKIFPHSSTAENGNIKIGGTNGIGGTVYFYTQDKINIAAAISEQNRREGNVDLYIDSIQTPAAEYTNVLPGEHKVYAVDKAGNKSAEITFFVVGDTQSPADFDGYITFTMPEGGNIYRGNSPSVTDSATVQNYVIKQNENKYKINVKLTGVTAEDKDVYGENRFVLTRYAELDPQANASPVEFYKIDNGEWQQVIDGKFAIELPETGSHEPYTIYLKDGCSNIKSTKVHVNWTVDGSVTLGSKDLNSALLVCNNEKNITYYKGETTPVLKLTGFDDSCYYPNVESSSCSNTPTDNYTLKSRLLVWTDGSTIPTNQDFYSTTIDSTRFSDWQYLTLKQPLTQNESVDMPHNYPKYDTKTTDNPAAAYKLYYIVEDKLGNYKITQLVNDSSSNASGEPLSLWMYDNTAPSITVAQSASVEEKINTIQGTNYYSENSELELNMFDTQSGIEFDGTSHYTGSAVENKLQQPYPLENVIPNTNNNLKISGLKDFAGNIMPDSDVLSYNNASLWVKQNVPALATDAVSVISCEGTAGGTGGNTTVGEFKINTEINSNKDENGKEIERRIKVKAPRSVTSLKIGLKVSQTLADSNNTADNTELLGWIISTTPLTAFDDFYSSSQAGAIGSGKTITSLVKNSNNEYEYSYEKSDVAAKWEDLTNKTQYFYAVNRAGLVCQVPVVVEFDSNPVPGIQKRILSGITPIDGIDINFLNPGSKVKFVSDVVITKCEYYLDNSQNPVLTVPDSTHTFVTESESGLTSFELTSADILSTLNTAQSLTVKLYTATEESVTTTYTDGKLPLTTTGYASSNKWIYDPTAPQIKKIFVPGIKEGTTDGNTKEYWITTQTNKTDLYITLKEENSGVRVFDFAGSTIKLTAASKLYKVTSDNDSGTEISAVTVDTENNKLTINSYDDAIRAAGTDVMVKITAFELVAASSGTTTNRPDNKVNLKIEDCSSQTSVDDTTNFVHQRFALDSTTTVLDISTTQITGFNYDGTNPTVTSYNSSNGFLRDRASLSEGGYDITPDPDFTNERYVKAQLKVTPSESGLYQLIVTGAAFEASGTNATTIDIGSSTSVPFTISNDGHTATFTNNKVYKGTNLSVTINNLLLPEDENEKEVSVTVKNRGERSNELSDTITLDTTSPQWVGDGIYVSTSATSSNASKVYPHPITGGYAYGIMRGTNRYFYKGTSDNSTLYLKGNVSDLNLPEKYLQIITDGIEKEPFNENSFSAGSRTMFAFDKAGNKTENKSFTVVNDTSAPASVKDYITIKGATKDGATVGQVYRGAYGSSHKYIIQSFDANENVTPYKIIVKLGGVTAEDKKIDGSDYTAGSAYNELYKTSNDGSALSTFEAASKTPIEYFKVKVGSVESAWIPLLSDSPITTDVGALKVTNGSSITIDLPNVNCDTIGIYLKDGCGNESDVTLVAPDVTLEEGQEHPGLTWTVLNAIGDGNYEVEFNGTAYKAEGANNYVLINNPYTGTTGTGGIAINNGVTYYKKFSTSGTAAAPKLILKYKDECNLGEDDDGYTLRARLIAGNWDTTPAYAQFSLDASTDEVTLTRKWASNWVEVKTPNPDTFGQMEFTFPDNTATAITGASATESYELWYVVENAVGKSKIVQLKNRTSSGTSDVTKWMYDDQAPTLDIENDITFDRVNKDSSYYYSNNSKATLTYKDKWAGIYKSINDSVLSADKREATITNITISSISQSGNRPCYNVYDILGNTTTLYLSASGTSWTSMSAPALSSSVRSATFESDGSTAGTSASGRFYATESGSSSSGKTYSVMAARSKESITATLSVYDSTNMLGWVVSDSALSSTALSAFYSSSSLRPANCSTDFSEVTQSASTYTFTKSDTITTWRSQFAGTKYFYAVNKAGLICQAPIMVTFASNPIPAITDAGITYTNILSADNVNYIKSGNYTGTEVEVDNPSSISFTSDVALKSAVLKSGSISEEKTYTTVDTSHNLTFTQNTWSSLSAGELKLVLSTATEDSDEITLTKDSVSRWTYDATRPVFTTTINQSDDGTPAIQNPAATGTYYAKSSKVRFAFSETSEDIAKYEYKASDGTWSAFNSPYELDISTTATTYSIRATDKAGNISEEQTFKVQKDVTGPSGTVTLAYTHEGSTDDSKIHENEQSETDVTTIIYNPSYASAVTLTASVTDTGSGVPSNYLYYKTGTKAGDSIEWGNETAATQNKIELTLEADHVYYCQVIAKDALGNRKTLHTYTFNGITPDASVTPVFKLYQNETETQVTNTDEFKRYNDIINGSEHTIYYNKERMNRLTINITQNAGNDVKYYYHTNTNSEDVEISSHTQTFDLPVTGDLIETYTIKAVDVVKNEKTIATLKVNGSSPIGTVSFSTENDNTHTKIDETKTPNEIYFNNSQINSIKLTASGQNAAAQSANLRFMYQIGDGTPVAITDSTIPCPDSSNGYTAEYKIFAEDELGNTSAILKTYKLIGTAPDGRISIAADGIGLASGEGESAVWTSAVAATDSTDGGYILTSDDTATTIKYNPSLVNTVKLSPSVTDSGVGSKVVVKNGETQVSETAYTNDVTIPVSLAADWTSDFTTYDVYAVDNVGNSTKLWTYKFKAFAKGPAVNKTQRPPYSGYQYVPTYPGAYDATDSSNWILGFADDDNYKVNPATIEVKVSGDNLWQYDKGKPTKQGSYSNWITRRLNADTTLTLPFVKDSLPSNKMYYALSYTSFEPDVTATVMTPPDDGWNEVSAADLENGYITNVQIDRSKLSWMHTFIWAWYKDALGNISVYNVTNPQSTGQNWWVSDTEGPAGTLTWTLKKDGSDVDAANYSISGESISAENPSERTLTIKFVTGTVNQLHVTPNLSDSISGLKEIKLNTNTTVYNNQNNQYPISQNGTHSFVASDNWGNTTTWKLTITIVENAASLINASYNSLFSFANRATNTGSTFSSSSNSNSMNYNETLFADNLVEKMNEFKDFEVVNKSKKNKKSEKGKKNQKKAAEVITSELITEQNQHTEAISSVVNESSHETITSMVNKVSAADEISTKTADTLESAIISAKEISEQFVAQDVVIPEDAGDLINSVESVIKSTDDTSENIYITSDKTIIQPQSENYEDEVVELKLIYVVIAILLAVAAMVAVIVIIKKQKTKK